jgi:hypothetical protein
VYGEEIEHSGPKGAPLASIQAPTKVQLSVLPHGFDRLPQHGQDRLIEVTTEAKRGADAGE